MLSYHVNISDKCFYYYKVLVMLLRLGLKRHFATWGGNLINSTEQEANSIKGKQLKRQLNDMKI